MSRILLLGCGGQVYREYVLASLFEAGHEVVALESTDAAWADPYLESRVRLDFATTDAVQVAAGLDRRSRFDGVLTYDETKVALAAEVAQALGLPGLSPDAARRCRDKHAMRAAFAAAGVPSAQSELVHDLDGALAAGERIGYPVVLKPRSLAGSIGVVRVDDPEELSDHFSVTASARHSLFPAQQGVLVEEFLDGPELSVESVVVEGRVHVCGVTNRGGRTDLESRPSSAPGDEEDRDERDAWWTVVVGRRATSVPLRGRTARTGRHGTDFHCPSDLVFSCSVPWRTAPIDAF